MYWTHQAFTCRILVRGARTERRHRPPRLRRWRTCAPGSPSSLTGSSSSKTRYVITTDRVLSEFALFWFGHTCLWRQLCHKGSALSTETTKHCSYEACSFQTARGLVQPPLAIDAATLSHNSDADAITAGAPSGRRNEMYNAAAYTEAAPRVSFVTGESLPR